MKTAAEAPSRQVEVPEDLTSADDAALSLILLLMIDSGWRRPRRAGAAENVHGYLVAVAVSCPKKSRIVAKFEGGSWSGDDADESQAGIDQALAGCGCDEVALGRTLVYLIHRNLDLMPVDHNRSHTLKFDVLAPR